MQAASVTLNWSTVGVELSKFVWTVQPEGEVAVKAKVLLSNVGETGAEQLVSV